VRGRRRDEVERRGTPTRSDRPSVPQGRADPDPGRGDGQPRRRDRGRGHRPDPRVRAGQDPRGDLASPGSPRARGPGDDPGYREPGRARTRGLYARSFATMKEAPSMARGILERLAEGSVLGDGGYLLELEKRGYVQGGPVAPEVVIEHPDALAQRHREFLRAGAEVLQTMTFYASDDKL